MNTERIRLARLAHIQSEQRLVDASEERLTALDTFNRTLDAYIKALGEGND